MLSLLAVIEAAAVGGLRPAPSFMAPIYNVLCAHPYLTTIASVIILTYLVPFLIDLPHRLPGEPPIVPSWIPFLGHALSFGKNPYAFLSSCRAQYGDIFTVNLAGRRMTFLCDPRSYPALFKHRALVFSVVANRIGQQVFDQSRSSVENEHVAKAVHGHYAKYLTGDALDRLTSSTHAQLRQWMRRDKAARGQGYAQVGLLKYITDWAFESGLKAMFGEAFDVATLQPLFYAFDRAFPLFVGGAPSFLLRKAKAARARLNKALSTMEVREDEAALMTARRALFTEQAFADYDVGATQTGILWASVANTVPAAFWTVAHLLCHPEALSAVREEIERVVPYRALDADDGTAEGGWTREQCAALRLTESAVNEALRLVTGSMVLREATAPTTLTLASGATVALRAGDGVAVYPALTHLDSRVFPDADTFKVDRFVDPAVPMLGNVKVPLAFMPFGSGVSLCPGRHWAKNEIVILVALLLQHCEWRIEGEARVPPMDHSRVGIGVYQPLGDLQLSMRYR